MKVAAKATEVLRKHVKHPFKTAIRMIFAISLFCFHDAKLGSNITLLGGVERTDADGRLIIVSGATASDATLPYALRPASCHSD